MKKLALLGVVFLCPFAAHATDMLRGSQMAAPAPAPIPAPVFETPVAAPQQNPIKAQNWTGAYAGLSAGYASGLLEGDYLSMKPKGAMGGAQVGYNYQDGSLVYGVELDVGYLSAKATDTSSSTTGTGTSATTTTLTSEAKLGLATSLRGRVGYAAEDTLVYVTLGAAAAQVKASTITTVDTTSGDNTSVSKTMFGWTLGAGVEYAMLQKMTVKLEYLYHDFGKVSISDNDAKLTASVGRIGVNYRF